MKKLFNALAIGSTAVTFTIGSAVIALALTGMGLSSLEGDMAELGKTAMTYAAAGVPAFLWSLPFGMAGGAYLDWKNRPVAPAAAATPAKPAVTPPPLPSPPAH